VYTYWNPFCCCSLKNRFSHQFRKNVSLHTRDSPLLVSSAAEAYKPPLNRTSCTFDLSIYVNFTLIFLKPNYMPNTALFMQLSKISNRSHLFLIHQREQDSKVLDTGAVAKRIESQSPRLSDICVCVTLFCCQRDGERSSASRRGPIMEPKCLLVQPCIFLSLTAPPQDLSGRVDV
jgi:hypothetical protein